MQGTNNNEAFRDKWNHLFGNQKPFESGNYGNGNSNGLSLASPFYNASPSIYSPYVSGTPSLPNHAFFGPSFSAALESTADRPLSLSSPSLPNKSFSGNNSLPGRDICSENNEACFFGAGFSSSFESFGDNQPKMLSGLSNFRECASPFIYSPCYPENRLAQSIGAQSIDSSCNGHGQAFSLDSFTKSALESLFQKPAEVAPPMKCRCGAIPSDPLTAEEVSRKVFVGGVPAGTNQSILIANFSKFGSVKIDWPKKPQKAAFHLKVALGYIFAIYEEEKSVVELLQNCIKKDKRVVFQIQISETRFAPVEVKAWNVSNAVYIGNHGWRRFRPFSVFAGGLPRTCTAEFLAKAIEEVIGPVAYCTIEQDKFTRYPKGAAQVVFSLKESYMVAIDAHEIHLNFPEGARKVELKPFLAPNMPCCGCGVKTNTKFCKALICLAYYCEGCWKEKHSTIGGMVAHEASKKMHSKKIVV